MGREDIELANELAVHRDGPDGLAIELGDVRVDLRIRERLVPELAHSICRVGVSLSRKDICEAGDRSFPLNAEQPFRFVASCVADRYRMSSHSTRLIPAYSWIAP